MNVTRWKLAGLLLPLALLVGGAVAAVWALSIQGSGDVGAIHRSTERYFASAVAGDMVATYDMLDSRARRQVSLEEWKQRNEMSLRATGPLRSAKVRSIDRVGPLEAYVTVELVFGDHEPLPVTLLLVRDGQEWRLRPSVSEEATEDWQYVEPMEQLGSRSNDGSGLIRGN